MYAEGLSQVTARTILIFFHGLARVRPALETTSWLRGPEEDSHCLSAVLIQPGRPLLMWEASHLKAQLGEAP